MSDGLPEQPHLWPRDPYRLLGVERDVEARELKRAYTRLIRRFKPEHFPEQFRRIRDAYETILQRLEILGPSADDAPARETLAARAGDRPQAEEESHAPPTPDDEPALAPFRRLPSLEEQLEAPWSAACDGDLAAAYRQLVDLEQRAPGERQVCERLYWLLAAKPELDDQRSRLDWLAAGLRNGWSGSLAALYGRELAADPAEAAGDRCARLLQTESRPEQLFNLAQSRWEAIEPGDLLVDAIGADLGQLRRNRRLGDDLSWAGLLLAALERLAWAPSGFRESLWQELCEELQSMHHLELRLADDLHRLDMLQELAKDWHALRRIHVSAQLLKVVRLSYSRSAWQMDADLDALLAQLNRDLQHAMRLLELVGERGPLVLNRLAAALNQAAADREVAESVHPIDAASKLIIDHLLDSNSFEAMEFLPFSYLRWRGDLLPFMLDMAISPRDFALALESQHYFELFRAKDLARELINDVPLNCLWLAHRLFWA